VARSIIRQYHLQHIATSEFFQDPNIELGVKKARLVDRCQQTMTYLKTHVEQFNVFQRDVSNAMASIVKWLAVQFIVSACLMALSF
jgi:hypothetical protein